MNDNLSRSSLDETAKLVEAGLAEHRAGRIGQAQAMYERALKSCPGHPPALHYLGVIALARGDLDNAARLIDEALAGAPDEAEFLSNRGVVAMRMGDHERAAAMQRQAIERAPGFANAHNNLANALMELADPAGAEQHYRRARELAPDSAQFAFNLGRSLEISGRGPEALAQFREANALAPNDTPTQLQMGRLLRAAGENADAAACFEPIIAREPDHVQALFELGYVYDAMHRYDEAIALYRRASARQPDGAGIVNNLAFAYTALGRYEEAEASYRRALELNPDLPESRFQLGMLLLRRNDYAEGWPLFENRKRTTIGRPNYRTLPTAQWQGEPLDGKRLLIAREQGVGDQIQFIRYAGVLARMGAEVDAWVAPEIASLCATTPGIGRVFDSAPDDARIAQQYDYWCDVMSLPLHLPDQPIAADIPYLHADSRKAGLWRKRVDALAPRGKRRIGIVWSGNPQHHFDAFRSIPLDALLALGELEDNVWLAMQKGPAADQLRQVEGRWPRLHDLGNELDDYASTAALIDGLDLVITVDTSVAHLAGALGKPVWVMLAAQPDWRWGRDRADSVWYPTARLFRQRALGDWSDVVAELKLALSAAKPRAANPSPRPKSKARRAPSVSLRIREASGS